jgi:alkanesulfonate monooxygenase SsuD/methylene tetrahydromethanopterin reductase-like flavin-dependent oxidoreductase (luciferase family)
MSAQDEQREPNGLSVATPAFDPTRPPPRRLVRLGVVFDGRTAAADVPPLARMCERAGIDIVWFADSVDRTAHAGDFDAWLVAAGMLGSSTAVVGAMIDDRRTPTDLVELVVARLQRASPVEARLELGLSAGDRDGQRVAALRGALTDAGIRVRLSTVAWPTGQLASLLGFADDIVLSAWHTPDLETAADEVRAAAKDAGRDPASLGVAALVPVSVGRTDAEAAARAEMDPAFARFGHPSEIGIFGTLEECQDRVIALAHAGITDLRCVLPATPDVHDVIAQLTAMTIGTVDMLVPGSLRSPAPQPPDGWGGRPDRPLSPRVSAGSRRRS